MSTPHDPVETNGASVSRHACLIYRSAGERWSRLADFVRTGLDRNERVLCLTDLDRRHDFLSRLRDAGLDATGAADSGQLVVRPSDDAYLFDGRFSPERSLRQLRAAIRQADCEGYAGFRVAGGTGWINASRPGSRRLLEYERGADRVLERHGCAGLCQYGAETVDEATLGELRRVHSPVLEARSRRRSTTRPQTRPGDEGRRHPVPGPADARHFHALLENISDIVTEIGRDGTIVYESPSVERVLGYPPEERIGENVFDFVHPGDREEARTRFRAAFDRPGTVDSTRVRIRHADGDWRLLEVQGVRPLGSPPVEGMIVTSRDITDRERYSRRLEKSRRRLRRLSHRLLQVQDEQRRRLSRELHDSLAQTLTAIRIRIDGLLTGRPPGTSVPEERGDELLSMVDGALDEVRELSASVRPDLVNEGRLVPALREFVRSEGSAADLDARFRARDLAESPDGRVATACMRIAREAVTNVIRHAEADRLTVTLRPFGDTGEHLMLEVADDGRGFRTGDGSEEELGLTGMLERALSVGGTLDVDSRPGRGTRVRARLPLDAS